MTKIYTLHDEGALQENAKYSLGAKEALIAYACQKKGNYSFWTYPEAIDGMFESRIRKGVWYLPDPEGCRTYCAVPE